MDAFCEKILERRLQSQDTDKQIMMETGEFKDNCTETLEENSAKEEDEVNLKLLIIHSSTWHDAFHVCLFTFASQLI